MKPQQTNKNTNRRISPNTVNIDNAPLFLNPISSFLSPSLKQHPRHISCKYGRLNRLHRTKEQMTLNNTDSQKNKLKIEIN